MHPKLGPKDGGGAAGLPVPVGPQSSMVLLHPPRGTSAGGSLGRGATARRFTGAGTKAVNAPHATGTP
jgi:hypothetical protein